MTMDRSIGPLKALIMPHSIGEGKTAPHDRKYVPGAIRRIPTGRAGLPAEAIREGGTRTLPAILFW
jgi:hypothetical protein